MSDLNQIKKNLVIGIGNYGRADDALGWRFVDAFSDLNDQYDFEYRYQLQIEDAELVSNYEKVIFVDASHQSIEKGFSFYDCEPAPTSAFTTHQLNPETVLWLAQELFNANPKGFVLAIEGAYWQLHHGLSDAAEKNLKKATAFFKDYSKGNTIPVRELQRVMPDKHPSIEMKPLV
jgi:hydrogenase maturation protease